MNRTTIVLVVLLVILGAIVFFIIPSSEERVTSYEPAKLDLQIDSSAVVKLEIHRADKSIIIENMGGNWTITSPINAAADEEGVKRVISGMKRFKVGSLISSNPEKQSIFQVDTNGTKLVFIERGGKSLSIVLGKMGPSYSEVYFRVSGSKDVYLGEGLETWSINKDVKEWRDKVIFATSSDSIRDLVYTIGNKQYSFNRDTTGWLVNGKSVDDNVIKPALNSLSNLRAEDFVDTAMDMKDKPVTLKVNGTEEIELNFYPKNPDSSQYVVKSSTTQQLFVIGKWLVQQILKPIEQYVSIKPSTIVSKQEIKPQTKVTSEVTPSKKEVTEKPIIKKEEKKEKPQTKVEEELPPPPPREVKKETKKVEPTTVDEEGELIVHTVKRGETMQTIAKKYNVTVEQILKWNLLNSISVKPGQELYIYTKK